MKTEEQLMLEQGIKERLTLEKIFKQLYKDYIFEPSDESIQVSFDGLLHYNDTTYIIEIKLREDIYDTLMLEQGKYYSLNQKRLEFIKQSIKSEILYIQVYNNTAYIFNLNKIIFDGNFPKLTQMMARKFSLNDDKTQKLKKVYLLPIELASVLQIN